VGAPSAATALSPIPTRCCSYVEVDLRSRRASKSLRFDIRRRAARRCAKALTTSTTTGLSPPAASPPKSLYCSPLRLAAPDAPPVGTSIVAGRPRNNPRKPQGFVLDGQRARHRPPLPSTASRAVSPRTSPHGLPGECGRLHGAEPGGTRKIPRCQTCGRSPTPGIVVSPYSRDRSRPGGAGK